MVGSNKTRSSTGASGWMIIGLLLWTCPGWAQGLRPESAGARGGFSTSQDAQDLHQAEVFGNWNLPWAWDLGKEWHLQSRLDLSAGWLGDGEKNAALGTVGPSLVLSWERLPVSLEGGVSPTFLSRHQFESDNFGMDVQFTSHVGLNWDFAPHWRLGYRFQHMSNADLGSPNPGLNMHLFALSYRF